MSVGKMFFIHYNINKSVYVPICVQFKQLGFLWDKNSLLVQFSTIHTWHLYQRAQTLKPTSTPKLEQHILPIVFCTSDVYGAFINHHFI